MRNRFLCGGRGGAQSVPVGVGVVAAVVHALVGLLAEARALRRTVADAHHQVLAELLAHGAVQHEVHGVVDEGDHVHRVGQQHVDVHEELLGERGHDDEECLRHLREDVHDDDDKKHGGGALVPGGPPALGTLFGLVGRGEQPLPARGALVQLLQQQSDEDGDERAGDELAADGVQPESSESQTTWVGGADGWFIEFVEGHVLKLHLGRKRKGRSSEGEAHRILLVGDGKEKKFLSYIE